MRQMQVWPVCISNACTHLKNRPCSTTVSRGDDLSMSSRNAGHLEVDDSIVLMQRASCAPSCMTRQTAIRGCSCCKRARSWYDTPASQSPHPVCGLGHSRCSRLVTVYIHVANLMHALHRPWCGHLPQHCTSEALLRAPGSRAHFKGGPCNTPALHHNRAGLKLELVRHSTLSSYCRPPHRCASTHMISGRLHAGW